VKQASRQLDGKRANRKLTSSSLSTSPKALFFRFEDSTSRPYSGDEERHLVGSANTIS
jgi:hypothetical protein